jgi:hypothetical protein
MERIFAKALATPAKVAERTMVDFLIRVVIQEVTDTAVVLGELCLASRAMLGYRLPHATFHALHFLHLVSIHLVVKQIVMAQPTYHFLVTTRSHEHGLPGVVLASQNAPLGVVEAFDADLCRLGVFPGNQAGTVHAWHRPAWDAPSSAPSRAKVGVERKIRCHRRRCP